MRAPLSIVIPTLNAEEVLPGAIQSLIGGLSSGLVRELVISDGGSVDATLVIAEAAGARVVQGASGRGGQLRRGAALASGQWLLFLHADTQLSEDWSKAVKSHIQTDDRAAVFRLQFRATGTMPRLVAGWANLRSSMGLPYGDQGLLISRDLYESVGGFPDIPLMEDVAMVRLLRGRIKSLDAVASTSADRYETEGWLRRGTRNLYTLISYLAGVSPQNLVRRYHGSDRNF
jgi:rSAM/selenodomain-associated transferase 2